MTRLRIPPILYNDLQGTWLKQWQDYCAFVGSEYHYSAEHTEIWKDIGEQLYHYMAHREDPYSEWYDPRPRT